MLMTTKRSGLRVIPAPSLAELTSIRLGGEALARVRLENEADFAALPQTLRKLGGRPAVLGQGSNILAGEGKLPLVLLELDKSKREIRLLENGLDEALVEVSASMPLPFFLNSLAGMGLGGLDGLAGIPGQVGGAVAMNAGSFGQEIKDRLHGLRLFSPALGLITLEAEELETGYRHLGIPALEGTADGENWFVILNARFRCPKQKPEEIRARMRACLEQKRRSQPLDLPSAGCVFKNPPQAPAGKLLEECGFKGRILGGMAFSSLHANFLVNTGKGKSPEALKLIEEAREAVLAAKGVQMELEVRLWV
ncbi:MAG: UDP-N-acetylmuramate dehydrogenase [Desulfovibrionaceae bacterium]|nr:UDP-N-acetylmuramate dehydrogenase [Desulfovibrionaceae bacterium]